MVLSGKEVVVIIISVLTEKKMNAALQVKFMFVKMTFLGGSTYIFSERISISRYFENTGR